MPMNLQRYPNKFEPETMSNPGLFVEDQYGPKDEMYRLPDLHTGVEISALFFPDSYETHVGKGKPVFAETIFGVLEFRPLLSSRLIEFLEGQGPGSTDMQIPFRTAADGNVYVYTSDGAAGSTLLVCPEDEWDIHEALRMIENYHLSEYDPDEDEEW